MYPPIPPENNNLAYDLVWSYYEGRAVVRLDGRYGVIDLEGNEVIPCWYDTVNMNQSYINTLIFTRTHKQIIRFDRDGILLSSVTVPF
jgi:hypothetical protein